MAATKLISVIVGRGTDPLASVFRYRDAVSEMVGGADPAARVAFNLVDAPAAGSNLRADAMAVDALIEIWPGRSRLEELRRGIAGIDAAHDVSAIHFDVEELAVIAMKPRRAPVKRLTLIQRLAGLSRAEFRLHWTAVHGEMARELPFVRGYAQNVVTGGDDRLDGFAIMHFDAVDRVQAAFGSPVGKRLIADTPRFCGAAASFQLSERVMLPARTQERSVGRA
jgi:uncharacterized protein (TIGR02118 family)